MPTNKNTLVFKSREDEVLKVWSVIRAFLFNMDAAGKKKKKGRHAEFEVCRKLLTFHLPVKIKWWISQPANMSAACAKPHQPSVNTQAKSKRKARGREREVHGSLT